MMMNLPQSPQLNINDLQRIFDKTTECYKLFWFRAILSRVGDGKQRMTYNELLCRMMADAYYMVNEYHLNLGPNDSLEKIVKIVFEQTGVKSSENTDKIYNMLLDYNTKEIVRLKGALINYVPYHLQSCFLHDKTLAEFPTGSAKKINELNQQERLLYYYGEYMRYRTEIIIQDDWFAYLSENSEILEGWVQYKLIDYLQRRNPTIPGIPNKISAPEKRKLEEANRFWRAVVDRAEITDCYTGKVFNKDSFEQLGQLEIDHFIPWSFIASDEIWNLTPTFKRVNINKSNDLPDMDIDLKKMAHQHHLAFGIAEENSEIRKLLDKFLNKNLNDSAARLDLYSRKLSEKEYSDGIFKIIEPLYMSAQNVGFKKWTKRLEA